MFHPRFQWAMCALALTGAVGCGSFPVQAGTVKKVFVIAMENHNWTQPSSQTNPQQIFQNPAAPFINSLVNGTSGISDQVAYANGYINAGIGVHPSEPNYIWAEAGTNFGVNNDDDPYHTNCTPDTVQSSTQHLSTFITINKKAWRSYQEDTDVDLATNTPLPASSWTVPLSAIAALLLPESTRTTIRTSTIRGQAQSDGVLQRYERWMRCDHLESTEAELCPAAAVGARSGE